MRIAVLYGGVSGEREVSLSTGKGVVNALQKKHHEVIEIDFNPNRLDELIDLDVDLVFIGLHGKYGEDGRIQGFLDMLGIPYVGSNVLASALAMDKAKAKQIFANYNIPVANSLSFQITTEKNMDQIIEQIKNTFNTPFVIKPNREGSTLGLTVVNNENEIKDALEKAIACDDVILVEEFIDGMEITVPVLGKPGSEEALPIIEIIPKNELYDYESKYTPGGSEHIVPARIDSETTKKIQAYAVSAHQALGCKTYSRVDFILTKENIPVILEVNTLPGMTPTSLFPDAAKAIGMTYDDLIEKLVELSISAS